MVQSINVNLCLLHSPQLSAEEKKYFFYYKAKFSLAPQQSLLH